MSNPKFIMLNGFAGSGKSTIARRYITEHPLSLVIEGDELIVNLGQWFRYENEARDLVYRMTKGLVSAHLLAGYDVVLPYLVTDSSHVTEFEQIALKHNAQFFNFLLFNDKDVAVDRLMERGTWGEAGTDPLSEKDLPEINRLYDQMEKHLENQENVAIIKQSGLMVDDTYLAITKAISAVG